MSTHLPAVSVHAIHGIVDCVDPRLFIYRNIISASSFERHLLSGPPYVSLSAAMAGQGTALTVDDSTKAAVDAARMARRLGSEVTIFVNGSNIESCQPYHFSVLNAVLDQTAVTSVWIGNRHFALGGNRAKEIFRKDVKKALGAIADETERLQFVYELGRMLDVNAPAVPDFLNPVSPAELNELLEEGGDIQNHGWMHSRVESLPPESYAENIKSGREWIQHTYKKDAEFFAVPYGDGLPPWDDSPHYSAWFLLRDPPAGSQPRRGVFERTNLSL